MPQTLQIFVSLTINPAAPPPPPPLVSNPASSLANPIVLPAETSGIAVSGIPVATVSGGQGPLTQPVIDPTSPNPLPSGLTASMDAAGNVTISGTPPAVAAPVTGTFVLDISDASA